MLWDDLESRPCHRRSSILLPSLWRSLSARFFNPPILVLAFGVVVGGLGQFAIQIPQLIRAGYQIPSSGWLSKMNRLSADSTADSAGGARRRCLAGQRGCGNLIASHLAESASISSLYYALRLDSFPAGYFWRGVGGGIVAEIVRSGSHPAIIQGAGAAQRYSSRMVIFLLLAIGGILFRRGRGDRLAWLISMGILSGPILSMSPWRCGPTLLAWSFSGW